jgi:hypothetical protein
MPAAPPQSLREQLAAALAAFATRPLPEAAPALFSLLGYGSKRQMRFPSRTAFLTQFAAGRADFATRFPALAASGAAPVFLQQLTGNEISGNSSGQLDLLASNAADLRQVDSYLFLAFPLPSTAYTQTELSALARALNSLFAQPVLVLFQHGQHISLAITYRRRSKTDSARDVTDRKVPFIRGIALARPHPGHLAILEDFSLPAIARARQRDILLTHDQIWFEMAREFTQLLGRWCCASLHVEETGKGQPSIPRLKTSVDDLITAERHLVANDLRAAAVYIRAAFEMRLREIVESCHIKVTFKKDPKKVSADHLWQALLRRHVERKKAGRGDLLDPALICRISAVRSNILNRLSHTGPSTLTKPDVQTALQTMRDFRAAKIAE